MSIYITTNEKNDGQTARPPTARLCGTAEHSGVAKEKAREGRKVRSPPATDREKRSRAVALAAQPAVAENRESWLQKTASRFKTNSPADLQIYSRNSKSELCALLKSTIHNQIIV